MSTPEPEASQSRGISEKEIEEVERLSTPPTPVIYETVKRLGDEEMGRPFASLWWSGTAAGLSISFSLLAQALLELDLPDAPWRPLVASFGYSVGFLMAVLSRQQLFTESTITAVLPLAADFTFANLARMTRMWAIVLAANLVGTLVAALFCSWTPAVAPDVLHAMLEISQRLMDISWVDMLFRGITAGFLIAAMVWLMPGAERAQFQIITLLTYLIALGGFTHIVAGSVEAFMLVVKGHAGIVWMLASFAAPTLLGNIIGGTALFAVIAYAQVMREI
ncbi:MAG TPA: formate/nitrite transporter family protein [Xanthobacteraceae bacterium]|nr:formate/nitrite transporter family protein [Xanthobacteraceae bacterium]